MVADLAVVGAAAVAVVAPAFGAKHVGEREAGAELRRSS